MSNRDEGDYEVIEPEKRDWFAKFTGFENVPFDPQGRLTDVHIEFLESSKGIIKNLEKTLMDRYARVVLIVGAAGIGKSTTIEELSKRINDRKDEFIKIKGISFGGKLRDTEEIREYQKFIVKTVEGDLKAVLKERGLWEEFDKRYQVIKSEYQQEYVPEIYAALRALKEMKFDVIHFFIDELDLLEGVEPGVQTNFAHFIRDLGENMINSNVPVAISLYAVRGAASIIEKTISESHRPLTMSIDRVYLFATKEEIKKIYKQRVQLKGRKLKNGERIRFRTNTRNHIEKKYSVYHPLTSDSIDFLYDSVARDLQEPKSELSTLRPLFRMFHAAFRYVVENETEKPLNNDEVKKLYEGTWFKQFIYDPIIRGILEPTKRLTPQEKEELQKKLGNLMRPAEWSVPDMYSLFVEGLRKCIKVTDEKRLLVNLDLSRKEDVVNEKIAYGSTFTDVGDGHENFNLRTNLVLFPSRFKKETFLEVREKILSRIPYAQLNAWIVGVFETNIEYVKTLNLPKQKGEFTYFFDKDQISRVICQSVVDATEKTRIIEESNLSRVNELVSTLVFRINSHGEICQDPHDSKSTVSKLLMTILLDIGDGDDDRFQKDLIDFKQQKTVGRFDKYEFLEHNGFISLEKPIEQIYRFQLPTSLTVAFNHVMNGHIQGDEDGKKYFRRVWIYLRKYLGLLQVIGEDFKIKGINDIEKEITEISKRVNDCRDELSSKAIPSNVEKKFVFGKNCIEVSEQVKTLNFTDKLKISVDLEKYLILALKKYYLERALEYLETVKVAILEDVPRIEITPKNIVEKGSQGLSAERVVTLRNTGKRDLRIKKIKTASKLIKLDEKTPFTIKPQEDKIVKIRIRFSKDFRTVIILETNDPESPKPSITVQVKIKPSGSTPPPAPPSGGNASQPTKILLKIISEVSSSEIILEAKRKGLRDDTIASSLLELLKKHKIEVNSCE